MPFVQAPVILYRDPHEVKFLQDDPQGTDGALENRGIGNIEGVTLLAKQSAGRMRLGYPLTGEINVNPSGKFILKIPETPAMAQKNQSDHTLPSSHASNS
jgi:hypothetical protein